MSSDSAKTKKGRSRFFLLTSIVIALISGSVIGGFFPGFASRLSLLGEILLNLLMMVVVPLVVFSIITGITSLGDIRKLGKLGRRTILYYLATTTISVLIGIILVSVIRPGDAVTTGEKRMDLTYRLDSENKNKVILSGGALFRRRYNENYCIKLLDQQILGPIKKTDDHSVTVKSWELYGTKKTMTIVADDGRRLPLVRDKGRLYIEEVTVKGRGKGIEICLPVTGSMLSGKEGGIAGTLREVLVGNKKEGRQGLIPNNIFRAMMRMEFLPLIVFSLLFGIALSALGEKGARAAELISYFNDAIHKLVDWIMLFVPIGIFGIVAARIGNAGGFAGFVPEILALGKYCITVLLGLFLHGAVVLPLVLFLLGKKNPYRYMTGVASALLNAFSTASSSATLPLTMDGVERENGISNRVASFVLPLGATINMDGTALYEAVAAIFIAQVYGISLGIGEQSVIFLTATLAAIGAAGIPEAGLITMVIVLKAVGLPLEGIGLILTVDWLLDRFRTMVNVWGDSVGAGVIEAFEIKD